MFVLCLQCSLGSGPFKVIGNPARGASCAVSLRQCVLRSAPVSHTLAERSGAAQTLVVLKRVAMSSHQSEVLTPRPWPAWAKWVRDVLFILVAFWAIDAWHTRNMLDGDAGPIAELTLVSLEGEVQRLSGDPERSTLLYFFAPWCSVCRLSMGNLETLDDTKVRVVAIALDYANQTEVEQFLQDIDVQVPTYLGTNELKERFAIKAYPSYYVLDEHFEIQGRTVGYSTTLGLWLRTL